LITVNDLDLNAIWNLAADYGADGDVPEGTPPGTAQLSYVMRVVNSAMGGGLGFAVEVNERFRVQRAIDGMRYFGLAELADLLTDVLDHDLEDGYAEAQTDEFYRLVDSGEAGLGAAFKSKAATAPAEFGL
jgi:hypothetical protein